MPLPQTPPPQTPPVPRVITSPLPPPTVPVQREAEVKDLQPEQVVSVIYTNVGDALVLLSAVALPHKEK